MHQTSNRFCGNGLTHLPAFFGRILDLLKLPDTPASHAAVEAATGFLLRFAYIERNALAHKRDAAADLCLAVIEAAANGVKKFEEV